MRILVKIKNKVTDEIVKQIMSSGFRILYTLKNLDIIVGLMSEENIQLISNMDCVESIECDEVYQPQNINIDIQPNLRFGKLNKCNYFGSNARVAVIDTGVNAYNIKLEGSVIFTDSKDDTDSGFKGRLHGTYVAHIIKKIAPWSKVYNLKVINSDGQIWKSAILSAIDWCVENNISVVNISLGQNKDCSPTCMLCNSIKKITDKGNVTVVAMGNDGKLGEGVMSCPANSPYALTVGAVDIYKRLAEYSSIGRPDKDKPDVLAPGWVKLKGHDPIEGTSFAAPVVSAIVACLINEFNAEFLISTIKSTCISLGMPKHYQGHGMISIENILGVILDEKNTNTN